MKCKKIRELLLTDYPDGELKGRLKNNVEEHLGECLKCRQFEHTIRKKTIEPFKKAISMKPRGSVWNRICEATVFEKRQPSENILNKLKDLLHRICLRPMAAFTLATVIIGVLILTVTAIKLQPKNQKVAIVQPKEGIEYLTNLIEEEEYFSIDENDGYNTAIEEYFF